jgi:hypothetical protein
VQQVSKMQLAINLKAAKVRPRDAAGTNAPVRSANIFDDDVLPERFCHVWATIRPIVSAALPAANPTVIVTGRVG